MPSMILNMNMVIAIMGLTHTMNMVFPNTKLIKMSTTTWTPMKGSHGKFNVWISISWIDKEGK